MFGLILRIFRSGIELHPCAISSIFRRRLPWPLPSSSCTFWKRLGQSPVELRPPFEFNSTKKPFQHLVGIHDDDKFLPRRIETVTVCYDYSIIPLLLWPHPAPLDKCFSRRCPDTSYLFGPLEIALEEIVSGGLQRPAGPDGRMIHVLFKTVALMP